MRPLAESMNGGAKPADEVGSDRLTGHPDLLRPGGSDSCGGELAGIADLAFTEPPLDARYARCT